MRKKELNSSMLNADESRSTLYRVHHVAAGVDELAHPRHAQRPAREASSEKQQHEAGQERGAELRNPVADQCHQRRVTGQEVRQRDCRVEVCLRKAQVRVAQERVHEEQANPGVRRLLRFFVHFGQTGDQDDQEHAQELGYDSLEVVSHELHPLF